MNTLIIRKNTGRTTRTHLQQGVVVETSVEELREKFVQTCLTDTAFDLVVFDSCSWADVSGDVYVFLCTVVPPSVVSVRVPPVNSRSVL
jgi:hypothetical protein